MTPNTAARAAILALLAAAATACADDPAPGSDLAVLHANQALWARMLAAETARGTGADGIDPLLEGLDHQAPVIRRIAVRALGRLERDSLARRITPLLDDAAPSVRAEAANALAQAAGPVSAPVARAALRDRLADETEPAVIGVLAESIGRLPHEDSAGVTATAELLSTIAERRAGSRAADSMRLGVARGFYFLARQPAARRIVGEPGTATLLRLATQVPDSAVSPSITAVRTRTVATAALVATGRATAADLGRILDDPDPFVRREAVAGLATVQGDTAAALVAGALDDPSPVVRFEALRADARVNPAVPCATAMRATADGDTHVALLAIGRLATGCGGDAGIALHDYMARTLPPPDAPPTAVWHRPAQAVVALAGLDSTRAAAHMGTLERSANPFVRMRAAQAATLTLSSATLNRLAADSSANVRTEAVRGLSRVVGHLADAVYLAQLREANDSQVLQTAAAALAGSPDENAVDVLFAALDRLTQRGHETERDARVALISRIAELGDASDAPRLARTATDYDPRVADLAAEIVERWTSTRPATATRTAASDSLPTLDDLTRIDGARISIQMLDGTRISLRLFALDAPVNAWRFARLAGEGYYNGLTFHRVVPNFVIQGGSPNANEYAGDGAFSRDELGLRYNWRGTIGLSTRGRDTGDAQIFINLIDNVRLDHEYTVFGEVMSGADAVHAILEGDIIRRVTIQ